MKIGNIIGYKDQLTLGKRLTYAQLLKIEKGTATVEKIIGGEIKDISVSQIKDNGRLPNIKKVDIKRSIEIGKAHNRRIRNIEIKWGKKLTQKQRDFVMRMREQTQNITNPVGGL